MKCDFFLNQFSGRIKKSILILPAPLRVLSVRLGVFSGFVDLPQYPQYTEQHIIMLYKEIQIKFLRIPWIPNSMICSAYKIKKNDFSFNHRFILTSNFDQF
jgi:hypothetical protein